MKIELFVHLTNVVHAWYVDGDLWPDDGPISAQVEAVYPNDSLTPAGQMQKCVLKLEGNLFNDVNYPY